MALLIGRTDKKAWVYREKWHAIALTALTCLACLGIAFVFVSLAMREAAFWLFGAVFGIVGVAMLVRFPRFAQQTLRDNGAKLISLDDTGLTVTHGLNGSTKTYPWASVSEIVLTKKLRLVDAHETTHFRHALIIFLTLEEVGKTQWINRVKLGLSKTAHGRHYYLTSYPAGEHHALLNALQAPEKLIMRFEPVLRFVTLTGEMSVPSEYD